VSGKVHTVIAVAAGILVGSGLMLMRGVMADREPVTPVLPTAIVPDRGLIDEVVDLVQRDYVEAVAGEELERAAVEGLVESLDPHSAFLDAAEYEEMRVSTAGSYTGVGIEVEAREGRVVIVAPIEGSPAARAGLRAGDVILEVDGRPVVHDDLAATVDHMRGFAGSRVRLAVMRKGEQQPLRFELERSEVRLHTVESALLPEGIGYVRIRQFSEATPRDLGLALAGLQSERSLPLAGLVLDLRDNPGGVLEASVAVADQFLDEGLIVRADGRTPEARFELRASPGDSLQAAPMVVLVDAGSASGAEIVAGALRDHGRATLMGSRTYGKGSVQTVMPLRGGQALKLTTSRYFTPSGTSLHGSGLQPDVQLETTAAAADEREAGREPPGRDPAVRSAIQYLKDRQLGTRVVRLEQAQE
jgi:carboxyl-terminal processing protease